MREIRHWGFPTEENEKEMLEAVSRQPVAAIIKVERGMGFTTFCGVIIITHSFGNNIKLLFLFFVFYAFVVNFTEWYI